MSYENLLLRNESIHFHNIHKNANMQISFTHIRLGYVTTYYNIHCTTISYNSIELIIFIYYKCNNVTIIDNMLQS